MPFTSYVSLEQAARAYRIQCRRAEFIEPLPTILSDHFRSELEFTLSEVPFERSEYGACENLIYPLLRAVWKPFHEVLTLWGHEPLAYDEDLSGVPDYQVSRRSPLGPFIRELPCLLVIEAKKDDFARAWGQCLAAMLAAQKLNNLPEQIVFGIATSGRFWEFGQLRRDLFTQEVRGFSLRDLDDLAGAIHFTLAQCRAQVVGEPCPA